MKNFSNVSFLQAREPSWSVTLKCNWFLGLALSMIKEKNLRICRFGCFYSSCAWLAFYCSGSLFSDLRSSPAIILRRLVLFGICWRGYIALGRSSCHLQEDCFSPFWGCPSKGWSAWFWHHQYLFRIQENSEATALVVVLKCNARGPLHCCSFL